MVNDQKRHILVSVCFLGSNLNVHTNPEKLRPSRETTDFKIHLLKVKWNLMSACA